MIEEFVQIPGPTFLMLFVGLVAVTIAICWLWMRADGSYKYQLPDLTRFDSIGIAQLRGGKRLIMQTAMFRLYGPELIFFSGEGNDAEMTIRHRKRNIPNHPGLWSTRFTSLCDRGLKTLGYLPGFRFVGPDHCAS